MPTLAVVGRCIYCDAVTDGLSQEHIVPEGLGGEWVLEKASCKTHRDDTSKLELELLRRAWRPLRRILNLRSRRPKEQPKAFPVQIGNGERTYTKNVSVDSYPPVFVFLEFDPPYYSSDREAPDPTIARRLVVWNRGGIDLWRFVSSPLDPRPPSVTLPVNLDAHTFARFLAKIALGFAIAEYGLDSFDEIFVRDLIIGSATTGNRWVGGVPAPTLQPRLPGSGLHRWTIRNVDGAVRVRLQLFVEPTGDPPPVYEVVVGRLKTSA